MSYVPSDFDSLNEGLNILNIVENSTDLAPYEGIYEDKGIGVVQQYSLHGNLFAWTDTSNLSMDFCYILKGGHPETYPALPSDRDNPVSLRLEHYITGQSTPVAYYELLNESYTITQDSNGNKVLLFENITLNDKMSILTHFTENEAFAIAFKDSYMAYIQDIGYTQQEIFTDLCSYNRSGVNNTPDTQQPIYLKWVNESTVNFSAQKVGGLDGKILITFSGTFDNSFMGDMFNDIAQISISYTNPHTLEDIYYTLEKDTDYTVDGNTFYSGTGASASQIYVNLDELFPEGIEIDIDIYTALNVKSADNSLGDTLPVFNWGEDTNDNIKYLNVNGKYKLNGTDIITTNNNNNYLNKNLKITDNVYYDINMDMLGKYTRYSTDELVIGKFFDGKPIYRKTFDGVFNNDQVLLTNVSSVVNSYGEGDPATGVWRQLPYFEWWNNASYTCAIRHDKNNNTVNVKSFNGGSASGCFLTITIEYTKTTD